MADRGHAASLLLEYQDAVDRLEVLEIEEKNDRRRALLWWLATAAVLSLGVLVRDVFALAAMYPALWLWARAGRRRARRSEIGELRDLLRSLPKTTSSAPTRTKALEGTKEPPA